MSTKIQINSLAALERLIGNDNELEIEVRNSVVQAFAEKHLKPLANSDSFSRKLEQIKDEISKIATEKCSKEVATFKTHWGDRITDVKLKKPIQDEIDRQVRNLIDTSLHEKVEEAIKFWANEAELEKRVNRKVEYYTEEKIATEVKKRLANLAKTLTK